MTISAPIISGTKEWRMIPKAPFYEVSDLGQVRLRVRRGVWRSGHVRNGSIIRGYCWFSLTLKDGRKRLCSSHSLVSEAFVGPRPTPLHQGAHKDSNRSNNSIDNLYWATPAENKADAVAYGSWKGERHHKAILTEEQVREIRRIRELPLNNRLTAKQLGTMYGVHLSAIYAIQHRLSWRHI